MKHAAFYQQLGQIVCPRKEKVRPADHVHLPYVGLEHVEAHTTRLLGTGESSQMRSAANRFYGGDVLYSRLRPYLNKVWLADRDGLCSSEFIVMPSTDELDGAFLRYRLNASDFVAFANSLNSGDRPRVDFNELTPFVVSLFGIDDQRRIVAEIERQFTRLDAGLAGLERVRANLKRYRAAVLKAACEGTLVPTEADLARAEGRDYETGDQLLERILTIRRDNWTGKGKYKDPTPPDTAGLPQLPEGWTCATIEQLSSVVRGSSPRPAGDRRYFGGGIPWITVGPITADRKPFLTSVPEGLTVEGREKSRYIEPHTLLLTNSGATLGVPKITLIGGCINDGVAALLKVDYPLKLYLLYFLHTQTDALRGVNQGAAQPNLNTTIIKAIAVPLPPLAEQHRIVAEVERRLSVIDELEALVETNLARAGRLRQSILAKAFSGELVPASGEGAASPPPAPRKKKGPPSGGPEGRPTAGKGPVQSSTRR